MFTQCSADATGDYPHPDDDYAGFALALHEAGHALGLSGFSFDDLILHREPLYETSHSTVPDLVMNYDREVFRFYPPAMNSGFMEHDCAPHPFDLMDLFALYQNVPR